MRDQAMKNPSEEVTIEVPSECPEAIDASQLEPNSSPRLSVDLDLSSSENVSSATSSCGLSNISCHRTSFFTEAVNLSEQQITAPCSLVWNNLTYTVESKKWTFNGAKINRETTRKTIFRNLSGEVKSGELTAVIGQSGVGKSSFLESLAGRRKRGLKGEAYLLLSESTTHNSPATLSFIPQKDSHLPCLTVGETLMYASQLKNHESARKVVAECGKIECEQFANETDYHNYLIRQIQKDLRLESCWNVKVSRCSGGELKRLSMAVELVSNPKIIILDEPTTGLDSISAYHCIEVLTCLTEMDSPPGIIVSIHQPSSDLLNLFHNVYAIGTGGICIYNGRTDKLVDHLADKGLCCPLYYNPAEFIIQVASGGFGSKMLTILAEESRASDAGPNNSDASTTTTPSPPESAVGSSQSSPIMSIKKENIKRKKFIPNFKRNYKYHMRHAPSTAKCDRIEVLKLFEQANQRKHPTFYHICLLLQRSWKALVRQPMMSWLRFSQYLLVGFILSFLHNYKIGELDGCYTDVIKNAALFSGDENYGQLLAKINDNTATIYFSLMFLVGAAIVPTVLTFPSEVSVMINERYNGWYSSFSYFIAKMTAELPLSLALPFLFSALFYYLTGQIADWWRFTMFTSVLLLLSIIGQNIGLIMGTIFVQDPASAVFMAVATLCPIFIAGGFLLRESTLVWFLKPLWFISYVRYAFGSIIASLYGFGRCSTEYKASISRSVLPRLNELIQDEEFGCVYDQYQLNTECFDEIMQECNTTMDSLYRASFGKSENRFTHSMNKYDGSFVMSYFEVTNADYVINMSILVVYCSILVLFNYWILLYKVKRKVKK